jgi:hypothetical protein
MLRRYRRSLDIAGDRQLSRIKTEQAILNLFDRDHLGNRKGRRLLTDLDGSPYPTLRKKKAKDGAPGDL